MKNRYEVIVIGGGIIGTAVTYYLARAGREVLLLERKDLASGSAGATDGYITYHTKKPGIHLEMAMKSGAMYETLTEELDADLGYVKECGGYQPIDDEEQWEVVSRIAGEQRKSGLVIEMQDISKVRKSEPELSDKLIGALYSPTAGKINPLKVTFAFARAAKRLGAEIATETEVQELVTNNGRVTGVVAGGKEVSADYTVNATGSWGAVTARLAGLDIPIKPRRGQIIVSEPVGPFVKTTMQCGRYTAIKHRPDILKNLDETVLRLGLGFGVEQTEEGTLLLSNTREWAGFDNRNTLEAIELILERAVKFLPRIRDIHFIRCFSGLRPYTPDGLPILGPVEGLGGFVMAAGHEGDGVALAPLTGKMIAEYIVHKDTSFPLAPFSHKRFLNPQAAK